ncbi:MAG TPA: TlpA disulfide reductase family protein [Oleiagrimonas sp.]|nr:TlpA disulfide reductase family protein [Oleiagrimonas sp.]
MRTMCVCLAVLLFVLVSDPIQAKSTAASTSTRHSVLKLLVPGTSVGGGIIIALKPNIDMGKPLPRFSLPLVSGGKTNPASIKGATTLVDFFFSGCAGCIEELPALNAYAASHPHMHFLAITYDDANTAKIFVNKRHFAWPVAYNGQAYLDQLKVSVYPTLLLLDANGDVRAMHIGSMPFDSPPPSNGKLAMPDVKAIKTSQVKWLDHWVGQHMASSTSTQRP